MIRKVSTDNDSANYQRAQKIGDEKIREFGMNHNNAGDALRHATWSRQTAKETNDFTAWSAGIGHEIQNLVDEATKILKTNPFDSGHWTDMVQEIQMDLHNNNVGRSAAGSGQSINVSDLITNPDGLSGRYSGQYGGGC